jgi:hypothetical protein
VVAHAKWQRAVGRYFDFLSEHGFESDADGGYSEPYGTAVAYRSEVSEVVVTRSVEFDRVEVQLGRLVDGDRPEPAIFFSEDAPLNGTLLDNVVEARAPERLGEIQQVTGLSNARVEQGLELWSRLLRDAAPDFLAGDDAVFEEAKEIIRQRVSEHPEKVEVWLPDTASSREASRAVERRAPTSRRTWRSSSADTAGLGGSSPRPGVSSPGALGPLIFGRSLTRPCAAL